MQPLANHYGYKRTFQENHLTLSLVYPLEAYEGNIPKMDLGEQIKRAQIAEQGNFASLLVRDVPLNDPTFGDAGQMYDPWVFLSYLAAHTRTIALGTASAIASFQHPINLAKSAASLDKISGERLLLGLATGDRPIEFDAYDVERERRATLYREAYHVTRAVWKAFNPVVETERAHLTGETDILPKPVMGNIPILVTGFSGQKLEWIAEHSDGWMSYPRALFLQKKYIDDYRRLAGGFKPFSQSLEIDLAEDPDERPTFERLGFQGGRNHLIIYLNELQKIGVNNVMLNVKNSRRPVDEVILELAEEVTPYFPSL